MDLESGLSPVLERAEKLPVAAASNRAVDSDLDEIKGILGCS